MTGLQETKTGLTAHLDLAGPACNAFGYDVANLTLQVTYDSDTRFVLSDHQRMFSVFITSTSTLDST